MISWIRAWLRRHRRPELTGMQILMAKKRYELLRHSLPDKVFEELSKDRSMPKSDGETVVFRRFGGPPPTPGTTIDEELLYGEGIWWVYTAAQWRDLMKNPKFLRTSKFTGRYAGMTFQTTPEIAELVDQHYQSLLESCLGLSPGDDDADHDHSTRPDRPDNEYWTGNRPVDAPGSREGEEAGQGCDDEAGKKVE